MSYISREAAIELLHGPITMSMCLSKDECLNKREQQRIDLLLIKSIPAADVAPVRHGRWIPVKPYNNTYMGFKCSLCGAQFQGISTDNYCGNCGAKMDGETDAP